MPWADKNTIKLPRDKTLSRKNWIQNIILILSSSFHVKTGSLEEIKKNLPKTEQTNQKPRQTNRKQDNEHRLFRDETCIGVYA